MLLTCSREHAPHKIGARAISLTKVDVVCNAWAYRALMFARKPSTRFAPCFDKLWSVQCLVHSPPGKRSGLPVDRIQCIREQFCSFAPLHPCKCLDIPQQRTRGHLRSPSAFPHSFLQKHSLWTTILREKRCLKII